MHCGYSTAQEARVQEAGEETVVVDRIRKEKAHCTASGHRCVA
jgi:hypothetical protein